MKTFYSLFKNSYFIYTEKIKSRRYVVRSFFKQCRSNVKRDVKPPNKATFLLFVLSLTTPLKIRSSCTFLACTTLQSMQSVSRHFSNSQSPWSIHSSSKYETKTITQWQQQISEATVTRSHRNIAVKLIKYEDRQRQTEIPGNEPNCNIKLIFDKQTSGLDQQSTVYDGYSLLKHKQ